MRFYSDVTKGIYDTEEELNAAETAALEEIKKKEEEKKAREQERVAATDTLRAALIDTFALNERTDKLLRDYEAKYGFNAASKVLDEAADVVVKTIAPESEDNADCECDPAADGNGCGYCGGAPCHSKNLDEMKQFLGNPSDGKKSINKEYINQLNKNKINDKYVNKKDENVEVGMEELFSLLDTLFGADNKKPPRPRETVNKNAGRTLCKRKDCLFYGNPIMCRNCKDFIPFDNR